MDALMFKNYGHCKLGDIPLSPMFFTWFGHLFGLPNLVILNYICSSIFYIKGGILNIFTRNSPTNTKIQRRYQKFLHKVCCEEIW